MKINKLKFIMISALMLSINISTFAQSREAEQLLLNVEKLSQLKNILRDMKKGYSVLVAGYGAVKNISQGNFSLHETFLDGLLLVSPEVRKYARVGDILKAQASLVAEYKRSLQNLQLSGVINAGEIAYVSKVYESLISQSKDNLDELLMVLTAGSLRMNDQERLSAIDRIFEETSDKLIFLRSFKRQAGTMMIQRKAALMDASGMQRLLRNN